MFAEHLARRTVGRREFLSAAIALPAVRYAIPLQATADRHIVLYVVGADGNSRTIGAGLAAAPAGTVIEVRGGTYREHVMIDKPGMKLRSSGATVDGAAGGWADEASAVPEVAAAELTNGCCTRPYGRSG